ncbi:hypothetical protein ACLI4Q_14105 [Natrialbaceae archaeon A-CW1-1]
MDIENLTTEEIKKIETHGKLQQLASKIDGVNPNTRKEDGGLEAAILEALGLNDEDNEDDEINIDELTEEDVDEMDHWDRQHIAHKRGISTSLSKDDLIDTLKQEIVHDVEQGNEDEGRVDPSETEQSDLFRFEPDEPTIDYEELRFKPEIDDDEEIDTRVNIDIADYYDDSPRKQAGEGYGDSDEAEEIDPELRRKIESACAGTALYGSDKCPKCSYERENVIYYDDDENAFCGACRTLYSTETLGIEARRDDDEQEPTKSLEEIETECPVCEGRMIRGESRAACRDCQSVHRIDRSSDEYLTLADAYSI